MNVLFPGEGTHDGVLGDPRPAGRRRSPGWSASSAASAGSNRRFPGRRALPAGVAGLRARLTPLDCRMPARATRAVLICTVPRVACGPPLPATPQESGGPSNLGDERPAQRDGDGLRTRRGAELRHRSRELRASGIGRDEERLADRLVRVPVGQHSQDVALARGQRRPAVRELGEQDVRERRVDADASRRDGLDRAGSRALRLAVW